MRRMAPALALTVLAFAALLWAADDPLIGFWKINVAKSKYDGPPPKNLTLKFEPYGKNGVTITIGGVDAQGNPTARGYSGNYDGKEFHVPDTPDDEMVVLTRTDAYTTERINKKAGKITATQRRIVSKDGKTLTAVNTSWNEQGQPVVTVAVFDKQ